MPGRIELEFGFRARTGENGQKTRPDRPMRILVMGDFSATEQAASPADRPPLAQRTPISVDIDNLEQLPGRLHPELALQLDPGLSAVFAPRALEDFHPDALFRTLPLFDTLRDLRQRLHQADSYRQAAGQLRELAQDSRLPDINAPDKGPAASGENESDAATLERLLGAPALSSAEPQRKGNALLAGFIAQAVAEHITPAADPGQAVYFRAADAAIGQLMRGVLHHPAFQRLEALWRGLQFLVTRLELDENLQLSILDVTRRELQDDFTRAGTDLTRSELYRLLVDHGVNTPGESPWSVLVLDEYFTTSVPDITLLAALGTLASHAGGPLLTGASPAILGCDSLASSSDPHLWKTPDSEALEHWNTLRAHPAAAWIGLALPRLLLRQPYGENSDEIDAFTFEELDTPPQHEALLWGNPAFGCAALIGEAFSYSGWPMEPGDRRDIGELPAYSYHLAGETCLVPCAEAALTETAAEKILAQGLMPLMSIRHSNAVRLPRFQSLASPPRPLAGNWRG